MFSKSLALLLKHIPKIPPSERIDGIMQLFFLVAFFKKNKK